MEPNELNNNMPRKHPFTVPERYFDNLPMQIQQRVQAQPQRGFIFKPFFQPAFRLSAVMAVILVLAAGVWFGLKQQEFSSEQTTLAQLSDQEIYQYLESDYSALETSDLAILTSLDKQVEYSLPVYSAEELEEEIELSEIEDYYL